MVFCLVGGVLSLVGCLLLLNHVLYLAMESARTYADQIAIQRALDRDLMFILALLCVFIAFCIYYWRIIRQK